MLTRNTNFTKYDWPGRVIYLITIAVNIFTITFHVSLLEVRCKSVHILIIWKNCFRIRSEEITVPDANKGK